MGGKYIMGKYIMGDKLKGILLLIKQNLKIIFSTLVT